MVRNVVNINNILFKGVSASPKQNIQAYSTNSITELNNTTPDFDVKVPQKYSKIDEIKLPNGLTIHSYKLANGHRVSIVPMEGSPTTVKNYVNVGSMNETDDIKGISHFLEHMAFNGTTGENGYTKLVWGDPFKKIEEIGGNINASTNYAVTDYYNSAPQLEDGDIEKQIKILAAMTENLALPNDMIEKEKNPVCSEINMIMDDPKTIAMDQTVRTLFNVKSSADELVGGSTRHIQNLTRERVKEYYDKYYTPDNMNLVITGDVNPDEVIKIVAKEFRSNKKAQGNKYEERLIPINKTVRKDFISDKATETNMVIGFAGPACNDSKSMIAMEILSSYLNREEFGLNKKLRDLNAFGGQSLEKISTNPYSPQMNLYMVNSSDNNSEQVLKAVYDNLSSLKAPDEKTLNIIKESLLMDYKDYMEYSSTVNNLVGNSILNGNFEYITEYENILKSITKEDIENIINKYFDINKAAITVVHPSTTEDKIKENYNKTNVNFKGIKRNPVNTSKVKETILDNNYKIAFCDTKNDNINFQINMQYDIPKDINPAVFPVLNYIYKTGIKNQSEAEYKKFNEDNNIDNSIYLNKSGISISGYSSYENFELNVNRAIELFNNPRINDEELSKAVDKIRDNILRTPDTAFNQYNDYEAKFNPYYTSKQDLLDNLDKLTKNDLIKLCKYISENSKGYIVMNSPEGDEKIKDCAREIFSSLPNVKPYEVKIDNVYVQTEYPVVLTKDRPVSQADISQIYKFKYDNNPREYAKLKIMNSILSSSDSIGLFNSLRERDHLAYTVFSDFEKCEDCGELSLNILTTTDNKEANKISYDNLQKSIHGFNRQIDLLLNSAYTDDDLETAKRLLKASLLKQEGVNNKLNSISIGMEKQEGIEYANKIYEQIDSITREEIDKLAKRIFSKQPIYSIVASKDTLEANKEFLEALKH